jgi:hypothetical protein
VAPDGGVFPFGEVGFAGSLGGTLLPWSIIGLFTTNGGNDSTLVEADGTAKSFQAVRGPASVAGPEVAGRRPGPRVVWPSCCFRWP